MDHFDQQIFNGLCAGRAPGRLSLSACRPESCFETDSSCSAPSVSCWFANFRTRVFITIVEPTAPPIIAAGTHATTSRCCYSSLTSFFYILCGQHGPFSLSRCIAFGCFVHSRSRRATWPKRSHWPLSSAQDFYQPTDSHRKEPAPHLHEERIFPGSECMQPPCLKVRLAVSECMRCLCV